MQHARAEAVGVGVAAARAGVRLASALALVGALGSGHGAAQVTADTSSLPASGLAVRDGGAWRVWWRSTSAPTSWDRANPLLAGAVDWQAARPGLDRGTPDLAVDGTPWRFHIVLARLDPGAFRLRLRSSTRYGGAGAAWTLDSASAGAALAFNAGQFEGGTPWGWLVQAGRERRPPGTGPLASAVVVDRTGEVRILDAPETDSARDAGGATEAFQSYPTLLSGDGAVPEPLLAAGLGIDVGHRDARLALCTLRDGRLLVALTRLGGSGALARLLPFGPTTPEMAALMGALGCARAVMLDGGLSSQLMLREADGSVRTWPGLRRVPLALEASPRDGGE